MNAKRLVMLLFVGVLGLGVHPATGAIIHIAKGYPAWDWDNYGTANLVNPEAANDQDALYEFRISSPIYLDNAIKFNRDGQHQAWQMNLVDGFNEVIFEDSATYNLKADITQDAREPDSNVSAIRLDVFNNQPFNLRVSAAPSQRPVFDSTGLPRGAWGTFTAISINNNKPGESLFQFRGIHFVNRDMDGLEWADWPGSDEQPGMHWGDAYMFLSGVGNCPFTFKDCIFEQGTRIFGMGGGTTLRDQIDPQSGQPVPEFDHCAFLLTGATGRVAHQGEHNILLSAGDASASGDFQMNFRHCTFVAKGESPNPWAVLRDRKYPAVFEYCLFYGLKGAVWEGDPPARLDYCLEWPMFTLNHIAGTGSLVSDPLLRDINAPEFWLLGMGSPARRSGPDNSGYDLSAETVNRVKAFTLYP